MGLGLNMSGRTAWLLAMVLMMTPTLRGEEIRPDPDKPSLDRVLEDLAKIDPQVLSDRLVTLRSTTSRLKEENTALQVRIAHNQQEISRIDVLVRLLDALVQARALTPASRPAVVATAPAAEPPRQARAPKPTSPAAARPAAKPAPAAKQEAPADKSAARQAAQPQKAPPGDTRPAAMTYNDDIRPLIEARCASCHNPEKAKNGLVLVNFQALMKGGDSGRVVVPGKPDESLLYRLITHAEEPYMPPMQSKLDADKLDLVRRWIEGGAAEGAPQAVPAKADADKPADSAS